MTEVKCVCVNICVTFLRSMCSMDVIDYCETKNVDLVCKGKIHKIMFIIFSLTSNNARILHLSS